MAISNIIGFLSGVGNSLIKDALFKSSKGRELSQFSDIMKYNQHTHEFDMEGAVDNALSIFPSVQQKVYEGFEEATTQISPKTGFPFNIGTL